MPLRLTRRPGSPCWWLTGTVRGHRVRESTGTDNAALAEECRATREAEIYRGAVHGRRPEVTFAAAALSYLDHAGPHSEPTRARLRRVLLAAGPKATCTGMDQSALDRIAARLLRPTAGQATRLREVTTPIRAVLAHAARRGWCAPPTLETPGRSPARTEWLTPAEANALEHAAAPHLAPLLVFLVATGARLGEALALSWPDVDLPHARALLRHTKAGTDRPVSLCPCAVAALAGIQGRVGPVFRTSRGRPYSSKRIQGGGQIKTGWAAALRRAGITKPITPHGLRHTWATWHHAQHRDLLLLRHEGGWSSVAMVERYAHLAAPTLAPEIAAWRAGTNPAHSRADAIRA